MKSNDVISNGADFFDILGVLAFCQLNREMGVGEKCAITRALSHLYWVARPCNSDVRQLSTIKFRYGEADAQGRETAGNDACCCFLKRQRASYVALNVVHGIQACSTSA